MPKSIIGHQSQMWVDLSRPIKQTLILSTDVLLLIFAVWSSYCLRLGEIFIPNLAQLLMMFAAPVVAVPVFLRLGLYRSVIRYLGEQALWSIFKGVTFAAVLWAALAFMTQMTGVDGLPQAIPLLYWLLSLVLISFSRFFARWILWQPLRKRFSGRQVLIYGAGSAGRQLAASLRSGHDLFPAGFLDDDENLHGKDIDGLRVYAPNQISDLIDRFDISDVIVTLPSATNARRREVVEFLENYSVSVRILPALSDVANGKHLINMVRELDIADLLGRDPVLADQNLLSKSITDKIVMVTGAGGSIGSELCRQIIAMRPAKLILLELSEHALYQIERSLSAIAHCEVFPCLGSITNQQLISTLISKHRVQTIYHAAAHKHVPLVEANIIEGTVNNVLGTLTLARAAFDLCVETFVLISTDKAVRPTNVMGATKRWAELIVQCYALHAEQRSTDQSFCAVRFGNVLGSSGSVIPLFKEQIAQGGPITVTHAEATRFFMSIHEAVELVIQAGSLAKGGEVFLLDMGEPVKILDLARNIIRLAGHSLKDSSNPNGDIEIQIIGLRPGEKLYEELLIASENVESTIHPKIMKADEPFIDSFYLLALIERLEQIIDIRDEEAIRSILLEIAA